jgi:hypothetical protein
MAGDWAYENSCQKGQPRNRKQVATFIAKRGFETITQVEGRLAGGDWVCINTCQLGQPTLKESTHSSSFPPLLSLILVYLYDILLTCKCAVITLSAR